MKTWDKLKAQFQQGKALKTIPLYIYSKIVKYVSIYYRDFKNKVKYGLEAPVYAERIWINPSMFTEAVFMSSRKAREESGQVLNEFPPVGAKIVSIYDLPKIKSSFEYWNEGQPWEKTEYFRRYKDKHQEKYIRTINKYINGFYDVLYEEVKKEGKLKTMKELKRRNFREEGGVLIHIGPKGKLYHGNAGNRRLSIAILLGLDMIPAMIGYVHKDGIKYMPGLRKGKAVNNKEHDQSIIKPKQKLT